MVTTMLELVRWRGALCLLLLCVQSNEIAAEHNTAANVLLITVDTLRADRLNCYGYPSASTPVIDQLANEGFRFEQAYTQVPLTLPSHYSILSGTYPFYHGVRDNSQLTKKKPILVSELLQQNGYRTGAFVGSFMLDSRFGLNRGFELYFDQFDLSRNQGFDLSHIERPAGEVVQNALRWITENNRTFFAWVHLFDPHDPYSPPEPFKSRFAHSPYDGEIAYVDHSIGILLAGLKEKGLLANTHILLTADHGEGMGEHKEHTHGFFAYDSTLHVPLIIRPANPFGKGKAIGDLAQSIDIAPTILRLVGLQPPEEMQGRSLAGLLKPKNNSTEAQPDAVNRQGYFETFYPLRQFGWSELRGIRTARYKFIEAPKPELYDLSADPYEKRNRYEDQQAVANQLREMLQEQVAKYVPTGELRQGRPLDPETLQMLQSLGYVATAGMNSTSALATRADPKEKIEIYNKILQALASANQDQASVAIRLLEEVLHEAPEAVSVRLILGLQHEKLGDLNRAIQEFSRVLTDDPQNSLAAFNLAQAWLKQRRADEAIRWHLYTLKVDPTFSQSHAALGIIYRNQKRWPQSIAEFRKALEFGPDYASHHNLSRIYALQGRLAEALEHAQEAVNLQPKQAESYDLIGSVYFLKKQMPEAERCYEQVIRLNPQSETGLINLAKVYLETGRPDKARNALQQALKVNPNQKVAHSLLTQLDDRR
jgi:arylsulfatase A-like enzyme/Tfp pilus assembly protein PilF